MSDHPVYPGPAKQFSDSSTSVGFAYVGGWGCPKCGGSQHTVTYKTRRPKERPTLDEFIERRIDRIQSFPGRERDSHQEAWDQYIEEWENTPSEYLSVKCETCGFSRKELPNDNR